jgi:probable selenium-dependent hydroxylase accessory protein YqeC
VIGPALGIGHGQVVAVVGAGGKTTLVYRLAAEAREAGLTVLVTTTTHMGTLPAETTGPVLVEEEGLVDDGLRQALAREGRATLLGRRVREDKLEGVSPERVDALARLADLVLVEADGARGRSLKVPAPHEPVVPASATLVVVMCGLDVLGAPLDDDRVHRVELVSAATGTAAGEPVDLDCVATALRHAPGYISRVPRRARAVAFLNKVEDEEAFGLAARLVPRLVPPYHAVAAGSAQTGRVRVWPDRPRL